MLQFVEAEMNKRTMTIPNGNKIHFERTDPYGFWYVHHDKGTMPDSMTGAYTTYDQAERAVMAYLETRFETEELKPDHNKVETVNASHRSGRDRK